MLWLVVSAGAVLALRWFDPPTSAVMLLEPGPVRSIDYRWVPASAIARPAALAVIAAEDQKFIDHHGFDFDQLGAAISDYREGQPLRGASTITQQVARNLFLWNGRSFLRKGLEAYFAVLLELLWPKERILEVYLNIAEVGGAAASAWRPGPLIWEPTRAPLPSAKRHYWPPSCRVRNDGMPVPRAPMCASARQRSSGRYGCSSAGVTTPACAGEHGLLRTGRLLRSAVPVSGRAAD